MGQIKSLIYAFMFGNHECHAFTFLNFIPFQGYGSDWVFGESLKRENY